MNTFAMPLFERLPRAFSTLLTVAALLTPGLSPLSVRAEDWPEWRGKGRVGVWNETGILEKFPPEGLKISWRVPIQGGYSGPSVADGRVFVFDFQESQPLQGVERLLCLDEETGKILWTHSWEASYARLARTYSTGPRATPTVDSGLVYVVGATGVLKALVVESGKLAWERNFERDFGTSVPTWGVTGAPLIEKDLLIAVVGGSENAQVVAFNKLNGKEIWRALSPGPEMGYAPPLVVEAGGVRQLIIWHPDGSAQLSGSGNRQSVLGGALGGPYRTDCGHTGARRRPSVSFPVLRRLPHARTGPGPPLCAGGLET